MGRVHGHSFKHLRGRVGDFIYKHYGDRVVVTRVARTTGKRSARQKAGQQRFTAASAYAERARQDKELWAFYREVVGERKVPTRSVAIRDFLTKPQINGANMDYGQGPGGRVTAWSKPAWKISRAEVEVRDPDGAVWEWGAAQPASVKGGWIYTLTEPRPPGTPFVAVVTAYDRLDQKITARFAGIVGEIKLQRLRAE
jgi:hypothetical protein